MSCCYGDRAHTGKVRNMTGDPKFLVVGFAGGPRAGFPMRLNLFKRALQGSSVLLGVMTRGYL